MAEISSRHEACIKENVLLHANFPQPTPTLSRRTYKPENAKSRMLKSLALRMERLEQAQRCEEGESYEMVAVNGTDYGQSGDYAYEHGGPVTKWTVDLRTQEWTQV